MATVERPLRRDAERNRQRILEAARELFAERGFGVTLNDIAHHAGVGVGTVYRRFPDKQQLIEALFEERLDELTELAESALAVEDPWEGLVQFLTASLELQARDCGMKELMLASDEGSMCAGRARERILPYGQRLIARAQAAGQLRADVSTNDMPLLQMMLGAVVDVSRGVEPELWRRYQALVLRGLRADPSPPGTLPVDALDEQRLQDVLARWKPPAR